MTNPPNRDHLATTNPVPNWIQHFAALGGLYDVVAELMGTQSPQALTIANGAITPSRGAIVADTEAEAGTDDLTTIAQDNLPDGRWLYLRSAAGGRTVVVKHGAGGAGQILLANAADYPFNATDKWLLLERYGTAWREIDRGYGADLAGLRAYLGGGNLLSAIGGLPLAGGAMTGALNMAKGAAVASAATTDIWTPADGNLIHVTGTTTITSFGNAAQAGAHRVVVFDGALTLTHGANLILPGAVNYTTAAGDMAFVFAETTAQHRLRILKADGTAVVSAGGGLPVISTATLSGHSSAIFTDINSTYDTYLFEIVQLRPSADTNIVLEVSEDGGSTWKTGASDYLYVTNNYCSSNTNYNGASAGAAAIILNSAGSYGGVGSALHGLSGHVWLFNPSGTVRGKQFKYDTMTHGYSNDLFVTSGAGEYKATTNAITAVRIRPLSGTFSGVIRLHGINKT